MLRATRFLIRGTFITCALLAGPAAAQTCIEPPLGLLGWWPGDGDSIDVQSSRLHGVAVNGAAYGPGLVGEAFHFDGVDNGQDDRVDLPPSALDGLADVTVEMWVQTEDDEGAFISGASTEGPAFNNEMLLFQGITGIHAAMRQRGTGALPVSVNDGAWHHLAFTRSGSISTLYVDSILVDVRSVPIGPFEVGPGGLMLGQEQDCLAGCFDLNQALDGRVDELSIYDRALSDAEIFAIFDAREAGKCRPPSNGDLLQDIYDLESEMETLLDRIGELEAAAEGAVHRPCENGRNPHACGTGQGHGKSPHARDWD